MKRLAEAAVIEHWAQAGIMFDAMATGSSPDLERLLLSTARHVSDNARLMVLPVTWLTEYGICIARRRLTWLIESELEDAYVPTMGLILDSVNTFRRQPLFRRAIDACRGRLERLDHDARPLFTRQSSPGLATLAARAASDLSRRWRLWARPFDLRLDALRPPRWVMAHNPSFLRRADLAGDLRCSIIETLRHDPDAGASAIELQRRCVCRTYPPVLHAIKQLERSGSIERIKDGVSKRIRLVDTLQAA